MYDIRFDLFLKNTTPLKQVCGYVTVLHTSQST